MSMIPSDDAFDADSLRALGGTVPSAKSTSVGKVGKFGARSWLEAQDAGMSLIPGMGRTPSWSETTTAAFARIVADARSGELEPDWREIRAGAASGRLHHARAREGSGAGGGTPMSPWAYPFTCQAETEILALREVVEGGPWDWEPGASGGRIKHYAPGGYPVPKSSISRNPRSCTKNNSVEGWANDILLAPCWASNQRPRFGNVP